MTGLLCKSQFLLLLASLNSFIDDIHSAQIDEERNYHQQHRHHIPQQHHHHHHRSHRHSRIRTTMYPAWDSWQSSTNSYTSTSSDSSLSDYYEDDKWPSIAAINSRILNGLDRFERNDTDIRYGKVLSNANDSDILYDSVMNRMRRTLESDFDLLYKSNTESSTMPGSSTTMSTEYDPDSTTSTDVYSIGNGALENILDSIDYPSSSMSTTTQLSTDSMDATTPTMDNITIDPNCVGDPFYCNMTYEEYMKMLYEYIYPTTSEWILIFSHTVVFIMGLVGNALVCIAVYANCSMRTVTNIFIVNLAVADFFVILFCLPATVLWDVTETWFMGEAMCKVLVYFQSVSVTVSVLTLTFISLDRWYAICFPLRYRTKLGKAVISVAVIWITALLSDLPEYLVLTTVTQELRFESTLFTQCTATWDKESEKRFYIIRFVVLYTIPLIVMTIAYFKIIRVLWKSETIPGHGESRGHQYSCGYVRGSCNPSANTSTMGQLRSRRKAAKMLVVVVAMFAGCYLPVHILSILRYTIEMKQSDFVTVLSLLSHWLCYANSAVNPVIYNFMSGKFRREFRNALDKCRCGRAEDRPKNLNHQGTRINNVSSCTRSNYQLTNSRDTRDLSKQTATTKFVDSCGNGHSANSMLNHAKMVDRVP